MIKQLLIALTLVTSSSCSLLRPPSQPPMATQALVSEAEQVVQTQLDAYNRRDLEPFLATYAPDVRIYDHPNELRLAGMEQMRERYDDRFSSSPQLHAHISKRIVQGNYVIDHEHVTGLPNGAEIHTVAIYEVRNGKIQNVWFVD